MLHRGDRLRSDCLQEDDQEYATESPSVNSIVGLFSIECTIHRYLRYLRVAVKSLHQAVLFLAYRLYLVIPSTMHTRPSALKVWNRQRKLRKVWYLQPHLSKRYHSTRAAIRGPHNSLQQRVTHRSHRPYTVSVMVLGSALHDLNK